MKGLLVKDLRLMRANKNSLLLTLLICVFYGFIYGRTESGVTMIVFMLSFILSNVALGSITTDDADCGMSYLMTLPNAKKVYVYEKYLYIMGMVIASFVVGSITAIVLLPNQINLGLTIASTMLICVTLYLSIAMPIFLKFGMEKGRIYVYLVLAIFGIVAYCLYSNRENTYVVKVIQVVDKIMQMNMSTIIAAGVVIVLSIYMISMVISLRILKKKSF